MALSDNYTNTPPNPADTAAQILSPITKALQKHGITLDYTCKKLKESMEAKETKVFNDSGKLIYSDAFIAHGIRLKASVEALKLQQAYPAERHEVVTDTLEDRLRRLREPKSVTNDKTGAGEE